MLKRSPCYNCKNREVYCHGQCKNYKAYKNRIEKHKGCREYENYISDKNRRFGGARQI